MEAKIIKKMKYDFCPTYCLRDPERDPLECGGCAHLEDIKVDPPIKGNIVYKPYKPVLVVGINRNLYYIKETLSNGEVTRATMDRDAIRKTK